MACKRLHHLGCPGEAMGSARPYGHQLSLVYWTRLANSSAQATGPHPAVSGHLRQGPARPTLPTGAPEVVLGPGLTAYVTPLHLFTLALGRTSPMYWTPTQSMCSFLQNTAQSCGLVPPG